MHGGNKAIHFGYQLSSFVNPYSAYSGFPFLQNTIMRAEGTLYCLILKCFVPLGFVDHWEFGIADCGLRIADVGFRIADCGLRKWEMGNKVRELLGAKGLKPKYYKLVT